MNVTDYLTSWSASYRHDFTENIMPFWMRYGLDRKHGGVYTCIDRDGRLTLRNLYGFRDVLGLLQPMLIIT